MIAVVGLGHLGIVTAAGLAELGASVIGIDSDQCVVNACLQACSPFDEPGLNEILHKQIANQQLMFSTDLSLLLQSRCIWIAYDTAVDEQDIAAVEMLEQTIHTLFSYFSNDCVVMISSQLPVGTTQTIEAAFHRVYHEKTVHFVYSPENLCLGDALNRFMYPERMIMGVTDVSVEALLHQQLPMFSKKMLFMSTTSAEMSKHAINAFLANSVVFINEIATLCEAVNANASDVARALKTDARIGPRAYLKPGQAFSGGTLARDVQYLIAKKNQYQLTLPLCDAILASNHAHQQWVHRRLFACFKTLKEKTIALLGLTYKPGTNSLRRSSALAIGKQLWQAGARVQAFDPAITELSGIDAEGLSLVLDAEQALFQADACIIATEWPVFKTLSADVFVQQLREPIVFDAAGHLSEQLANDPRIHYCRVGENTCV